MTAPAKLIAKDHAYVDRVLELLKQNLSVARVAKTANCKEHAVRRIAKVYNIEIYKKQVGADAFTEKRLDEFHVDLLRGWTLLMMQNKYSISRHTAHRLIHQCGYKDFNEVRTLTGRTSWKDQKEALSWIPETMTQDGMSLHWLSKQWR